MNIALRPLTAAESSQIVTGVGVPAPNTRWAEDYPTADTVIALRLLADAYAALGVPVGDRPVWWLNQILIVDLVVGDIGFHGPPDPDGVVEIGYCVAESWRGRGVATAACRQLVDVARHHGATTITAEAAPDNLASRAVLRSAGFRPTGGDRFASGGAAA